MIRGTFKNPAEQPKNSVNDFSVHQLLPGLIVQDPSTMLGISIGICRDIEYEFVISTFFGFGTYNLVAIDLQILLDVPAIFFDVSDTVDFVLLVNIRLTNNTTAWER